MVQLFENKNRCKDNDGHGEKEFFKDPRKHIDGHYDHKSAIPPYSEKPKKTTKNKKEIAGFQPQINQS
ncbi:hypothetical protein NUSPORA_00636 [Nucleospora cyclopteri]